MDFLGARYHKSNISGNSRWYQCANRISGNCRSRVRLLVNQLDIADLNGPILEYAEHVPGCNFFDTNSRLAARFGHAAKARNEPATSKSNDPPRRIVDCESSTEQSDEEIEQVVGRSHAENDEGSKTEFDQDYIGQANQSLFSLEVALNSLNETAPFITNKSIFKDKLNGCKQQFVNLLKTFDLAGPDNNPLNTSHQPPSTSRAKVAQNDSDTSDSDNNNEHLVPPGKRKRKKPIHSNAYFARRNYQRVINKRFAAQQKEQVEEPEVPVQLSVPLAAQLIRPLSNPLGNFKIPKKVRDD